MNICIVDYDINPPWVEAVRALAFELSRQLVEDGQSVHIVTSATPTVALEEEIDGVLFHRVSKKPFLSFFLARKVKKLHELYKFDVIHIHNSLMTKSFIVTLLLLRKWVRLPMIAYICLQPTTSLRDLIHFLRFRKLREDFRRMTGWLVGALTPNFFVKKEFDMVDKIITSSNYLKTEIIRLGIEPNKIDTVYPFINAQEFAVDFDQTSLRENLGLSKNAPLILYGGSTEPARLGSLLKALPIVLKEIPNSKVVLVSSHKHTHPKQFFSLVMELGLQRDLTILPQHVKIGMLRLIATSNVFVYPGFSAIVSVDPPRTIIEAMTIGVPIVASRTGGIPEITKGYNSCLLVEPFDYKGMADALIKLLKIKSINSRSERRRTVHLRTEFDSRFAALHFISIYEHVISNRATASTL